ncbi:hypothetical protein FB446DRAFT_787174 [Lentinula raphanica]|nr:hypothetical protein FB446DRAFT_787174 [Lentinula raphanica]
MRTRRLLCTLVLLIWLNWSSNGSPIVTQPKFVSLPGFGEPSVGPRAHPSAMSTNGSYCLGEEADMNSTDAHPLHIIKCWTGLQALLQFLYGTIRGAPVMIIIQLRIPLSALISLFLLISLGWYLTCRSSKPDVDFDNKDEAENDLCLRKSLITCSR